MATRAILGFGAPGGCRQYVSQPGIRKIAQPTLVAAARGMRRWLQRPHDKTNGATGAGDGNQPLRKPTWPPWETARGNKWHVPQGQPGEASPAMAKRARQGEGRETRSPRRRQRRVSRRIQPLPHSRPAPRPPRPKGGKGGGGEGDRTGAPG